VNDEVGNVNDHDQNEEGVVSVIVIVENDVKMKKREDEKYQHHALYQHV
jgi:hypothetical protein